MSLSNDAVQIQPLSMVLYSNLHILECGWGGFVWNKKYFLYIPDSLTLKTIEITYSLSGQSVRWCEFFAQYASFEHHLVESPTCVATDHDWWNSSFAAKIPHNQWVRPIQLKTPRKIIKIRYGLSLHKYSQVSQNYRWWTSWATAFTFCWKKVGKSNLWVISVVGSQWVSTNV